MLLEIEEDAIWQLAAHQKVEKIRNDKNDIGHFLKHFMECAISLQRRAGMKAKNRYI